MNGYTSAKTAFLKDMFLDMVPEGIAQTKPRWWRYMSAPIQGTNILVFALVCKKQISVNVHRRVIKPHAGWPTCSHTKQNRTAQMCPRERIKS